MNSRQRRTVTRTQIRALVALRDTNGINPQAAALGINALKGRPTSRAAMARNLGITPSKAANLEETAVNTARQFARSR
jgi:hypothetical protein